MSREKVQIVRLKLRNVSVSCVGALGALATSRHFLHHFEVSHDPREIYASTAFSFLVFLFTLHIRNIVKSL